MAQESYLSELVPKTAEILRGQKVDQRGALCWQVVDSGEIEVLLISSKDTGRWVIPKGNIEKNEPLHKCAQREALEEAGIKGRVSKKALGYYTYLKDVSKPPFLVSVFLLEAENVIGTFKEVGKRKLIWVSPSEAVAMVGEPD
ncbi:NUDIX hydrolase [Rhizobium sp. 1399]|jgi:8-oxo-dGTP pyrophosphatase MutT (NUDIX family)|uniref:NUDIX hydrolase n=1 Tax=Rhizobium sp. 1399 TaxID=2817758 RepID=UPI002862F6C2|nr:NUDIX hydrolase [Rhizobium sp. 1399]MDR6670460.1 8-oxo-dGTP pyrophosphatase MutT (NUDIX family) [Rhizobium sp. 1399]